MRAHVLVECDVALPAMDRIEALEAAGFTVERCSGPGHHRCPVLEGAPCEAVTLADVVVNHLSGNAVEVSTATALLHPDTPQVTMLSPLDAEALTAILRGGPVVPNDLTDRGLVDAVFSAWAAARRDAP